MWQRARVHPQEGHVVEVLVLAGPVLADSPAAPDVVGLHPPLADRDRAAHRLGAPCRSVSGGSVFCSRESTVVDRMAFRLNVVTVACRSSIQRAIGPQLVGWAELKVVRLISRSTSSRARIIAASSSAASIMPPSRDQNLRSHSSSVMGLPAMGCVLHMTTGLAVDDHRRHPGREGDGQVPLTLGAADFFGRIAHPDQRLVELFGPVDGLLVVPRNPVDGLLVVGQITRVKARRVVQRRALVAAFGFLSQLVNSFAVTGLGLGHVLGGGRDHRLMLTVQLLGGVAGMITDTLVVGLALKQRHAGMPGALHIADLHVSHSLPSVLMKNSLA